MNAMRLLLAGAVGAVAWGAASTAGPPAGASRGGAEAPPPTTRCEVPALPGTVVKVTLTDTGGMSWRPHDDSPGYRPQAAMRGTMRLTAAPSVVRQGTVSLKAINTGTMAHEVVVLPLPPGHRPGQRPVGANGKADETGMLGEAARTCGKGAGEGILPHSAGWTTLTLKPGHYELICNLPGHYAGGMYDELDVTG
ncbi:hypothetical protein [Sphaerisporangium fuscum]|uniref:hypothetical protein n=1 Tax=Sphaerisporangium fuscum TaxID=2835868 RepID=UPI001BDCF83C|nr:hypothetical protein [Sphaerisporangium fuscum]